MSRNGTLPELRNEAIDRADRLAHLYAVAELAFFRKAVEFERTVSAGSMGVAVQLRHEAAISYARFADAMDDLSVHGLGRFARVVWREADDRILDGRRAYLHRRGLPADLATKIDRGVRPSRAPGEGNES